MSQPAFLSTITDYRAAPIGTRVEFRGDEYDYWEKTADNFWISGPAYGGDEDEYNEWDDKQLCLGQPRKVLRWIDDIDEWADELIIAGGE